MVGLEPAADVQELLARGRHAGERAHPLPGGYGLREPGRRPARGGRPGRRADRPWDLELEGDDRRSDGVRIATLSGACQRGHSASGKGKDMDYDAIIVGTGFGASVAVSELVAKQ